MQTELNLMLADQRHREIQQRAERDNELQRALRANDDDIAREVRAARHTMLSQHIRRRLNGLRSGQDSSTSEIANGKLGLAAE
jgi:hypothetical protein